MNSYNFEQCLKCDLCTTVCPMMAANPYYPGPKQAGPDGERYRIKDPQFYDLTLEYCLNCKRCEVACPSGVKVGDIIQTARLNYARKHHPVRDFILADTDFAGSLATPFAPIVNRALSVPVVQKAMDKFLGVDSRRRFPEYTGTLFESWFRREAIGQQEKFKRKVAFFHGCYVNYNYPQLGRDLVAVLNACGYGVKLLEKEKCCGVALISNGMKGMASRNANINISSMRKASCEVLTVSSTCTFTIRDEYEALLGMETSDIKENIMLATKFLYSKVESGEVRLAFRDNFHMRAAYHTACHMNKLGWAVYSTSLMRMIPGMELVVLEQECCGIAGTFGFKKENYGYSQKIGAKLFNMISAANPEMVITDCETCKWQIEMSTGIPVANPVSVLAEALDLEKTYELNNKE